MFKCDALPVRALNYARKEHVLSYVALRMMMSSVQCREKLSWLGRFVERNINRFDSKSYAKYYKYKSIDGGVVEARECKFPKPSVALAESYVLYLLSSSSAVPMQENVYSYRWPKSDMSCQNYDYFFNGYLERERNVSAALMANNLGCAVICDIKTFYPTVDMSTLSSLACDLVCRSVVDPNVKSVVCKYIENYCHIHGGGLPIGPALSHVLAQIYLSHLDRQLIAAYGARYFRYVDDIIVVCSRNDADNVARHIDCVVQGEGLSLNDGKTVRYFSNIWKSPALDRKEMYTENFESFMQILGAYLVFHSDKYDELLVMLKGEGFNIPLSQLRSLSKYNKYVQFVLGQFRKNSSIVWKA
jgi:hypothetical protein